MERTRFFLSATVPSEWGREREVRRRPAKEGKGCRQPSGDQPKPREAAGGGDLAPGAAPNSPQIHAAQPQAARHAVVAPSPARRTSPLHHPATSLPSGRKKAAVGSHGFSPAEPREKGGVRLHCSRTRKKKKEKKKGQKRKNERKENKKRKKEMVMMWDLLSRKLMGKINCGVFNYVTVIE